MSRHCTHFGHRFGKGVLDFEVKLCTSGPHRNLGTFFQNTLKGALNPMIIVIFGETAGKITKIIEKLQKYLQLSRSDDAGLIQGH